MRSRNGATPPPIKLALMGGGGAGGRGTCMHLFGFFGSKHIGTSWRERKPWQTTMEESILVRSRLRRRWR